MILGLSTATFTLVHVSISLIAIGSGFVVMFGLLMGKRLNRWTAAFLAATALTTITGFAFPFHHLKPAHMLGIASLTILALAISARYLFLFAGPGDGSMWLAPLSPCTSTSSP